MVILHAQAGAMETWECSAERQDRECAHFRVPCRRREYVSTFSGGLLPIESQGAMINGRTAGRNLAADTYMKWHCDQSGKGRVSVVAGSSEIHNSVREAYGHIISLYIPVSTPFSPPSDPLIAACEALPSVAPPRPPQLLSPSQSPIYAPSRPHPV